MPHDIFISYATRNAAAAQNVCATLEPASIRCWIAPRDVQPGRAYAGEITRAIQGSKAMVLIFSSAANGSEQVLREVQLAVDARLQIIQFRLESVAMNDDLKFYLGTPHWLDGSDPPSGDDLERLREAVAKLLQIPAPPRTPDTFPSHTTRGEVSELSEATLFSATIRLSQVRGSKDEFFRKLRPVMANFVGEKADDVVTSMEDRENILSTGGGFGLACPHTYRPYVKRFIIGVISIPEGCEWDSADGEPVNIVVLYVGAGDARSRQALAVMGKAHKVAASILARPQDSVASTSVAATVLDGIKDVLVANGLSIGVLSIS